MGDLGVIGGGKHRRSHESTGEAMGRVAQKRYFDTASPGGLNWGNIVHDGAVGMMASKTAWEWWGATVTEQSDAGKKNDREL